MIYGIVFVTFFKTGQTFACFQFVGMLSVESDFWNICSIMVGVMPVLSSLSILPLTWSGPITLCGFILFNNLVILILRTTIHQEIDD